MSVYIDFYFQATTIMYHQQFVMTATLPVQCLSRQNVLWRKPSPHHHPTLPSLKRNSESTEAEDTVLYRMFFRTVFTWCTVNTTMSYRANTLQKHSTVQVRIRKLFRLLVELRSLATEAHDRSLAPMEMSFSEVFKKKKKPWKHWIFSMCRMCSSVTEDGQSVVAQTLESRHKNPPKSSLTLEQSFEAKHHAPTKIKVQYKDESTVERDTHTHTHRCH